MAELIAVVGASGSGKTTSLRNLDPASTFVISVTGKALPFKGAKKNYIPIKKDESGKKWIGNYFVSSDSSKICNVLKMIEAQMSHIQNIIIDDIQYIMSFESMDRASEKNFDKFVELAAHYFDILKQASSLPDGVNVIITSHADNEGDAINPYFKIKTVGKLLDKMITVEGLFTYVFFTNVINDEGIPQYKFITNSDGTSTAKTPMGLFNELLIDNDIQLIIDSIRKYNEGE